MPKLPSLEDMAKRRERSVPIHDFEQASHILEAMDFLRKEAVKTRIPEIVTMVDAVFRLLLTSYYCIPALRNEGICRQATKARCRWRKPLSAGEGGRTLYDIRRAARNGLSSMADHASNIA